MNPPAMNAIPMSESPLMFYGEVIYSNYGFNPSGYSIYCKVKCPHCRNYNKHGIPIDPIIHHRGDGISERRQCEHCFHEYRFLIII